MWLVLLIVAVSWLAVASRYARSARRRELGVRFVHNPTGRLVGAATTALLLTVYLLSGGGWASAGFCGPAGTGRGCGI